MAGNKTRRSANLCVDHMASIGLRPRLILNVGVGVCHPELFVWRKRMPGTLVLGVDIRLGNGIWDAMSVNALVGEKSGEAMFCRFCHSIKCEDKTHRRHRPVKITTIDKIMAGKERKRNFDPIFLWMDIEGAELDALKGAERTLPKIPLINLEYVRGKKPLHEFLISNGYFKVQTKSVIDTIDKYHLQDVLYQRNDYVGMA